MSANQGSAKNMALSSSRPGGQMCYTIGREPCPILSIFTYIPRIRCLTASAASSRSCGARASGRCPPWRSPTTVTSSLSRRSTTSAAPRRDTTTCRPSSPSSAARRTSPQRATTPPATRTRPATTSSCSRRTSRATTTSCASFPRRTSTASTTIPESTATCWKNTTRG